MADRELAEDVAVLLLSSCPEWGSAEDVTGVLLLALEQYSRGFRLLVGFVHHRCCSSREIRLREAKYLCQ